MLVACLEWKTILIICSRESQSHVLYQEVPLYIIMKTSINPDLTVLPD